MAPNINYCNSTKKTGSFLHILARKQVNRNTEQCQFYWHLNYTTENKNFPTYQAGRIHSSLVYVADSQ